eukprot:m.206275 g.206275  ORF g.206275 m.206275 type:complete len:61 (-) comp18897_c0_seq2:222-404(-)
MTYVYGVGHVGTTARRYIDRIWIKMKSILNCSILSRCLGNHCGGGKSFTICVYVVRYAQE